MGPNSNGGPKFLWHQYDNGRTGCTIAAGPALGEVCQVLLVYLGW